jgi:hypothetical protein
MRNPFLLLFFIALLPGCAMQAHLAETGGMATYDGVSAAYPGDAQFLATTAALELARRYPPAKTSLALVKTKTSFSQHLESALREQGFSITGPDSSSGVRVGYTLDVLRDKAPPTCYLQVRTSDGSSFGTVRELTNMASLETKGEAPGKESISASSSVESFSLSDEPAATAPVTLASPPASASEAASVAPTAPELAASPSSDAGVPLRTKGTAARIAKRNRIAAAEFCRLNNVKPDTVLQVGRRVYLHAPAPMPVTASAPQATLPVGAGDRQPKSLAVQTASSVPIPVPSAAFAKPYEPAPAPETVPARPSDPAPIPPATAAPVPASPVQEALAEYAPSVGLGEDFSSAVSTPSWNIEPGSLHVQLETWALRAHYQLIWKAMHDFEMEARAKFNGEFVGAIQQLFAGLHRSGHALRVTVYQGNNVIEVAED